MQNPEHLRIQANGIDFAALGWGSRDAPLALLVHGYPDTAWTFRHLGPHLAQQGFRAVAPFTRGYAPTSLAPDDSYLVADQAQDILALHDALRGDDRAVLVGHDWGAVATWTVTELEPHRFRKYVALAVPPAATILKPFTTRSGLPLALRQMRRSWYFAYNQLPASERGLDRVIPRLWRDWSPGYDASDDLDRVFRALAGPGRRRAALKYYRDNLRKGAAALFAQRPAAPALYLHGADDGCMQVELIEAWHEALPAGARFVRIDDAGHFLHLEQPQAVHRLIDEWLT